MPTGDARLDVERLAVSISSTLAGSAGDDLDRALDRALGELCRFVGADRAVLRAHAEGRVATAVAHEWHAEGRPPPTPATEPVQGQELVIPLGSRGGEAGTLTLQWAHGARDDRHDDILHLLGNVFLAAHRRQQAEARHAATEHRERLLLDTLAAGVVLIHRPDGRVVSANPAAANILGAEADELLGVDVLSADVQLLDTDGAPLPLVDRLQLLGADSQGVTRELGYRGPDGSVVWIEVRAVGLVLDGDDHLAATFIDVTDRRQAVEQLVSSALHDPLTGLPNRRLLGEHARAALARAARDGSTTALVYFDLDRFKRVNDHFGHAAGDALLTAVAERVGAQLRGSDMLARVGGDEFVAVLSDLPDPGAASSLAQRIQRVLAVPVPLDDVSHPLAASIGIATATGAEASAVTVDQLLQHADQAMYAAKQSGRGRTVTWSDALVSAARARDDLEVALHRSLVDGDFVLHYQPVLERATGHVVGAEALVRWRHPERGLLPPAEFLGVAEESGLVVPLGQWVLEEACARATTWPDHVWVSVNLSARQVSTDDAAARVRGVLEGSGLRPERLHLELTETALIEGSDAALAALAAIRDLGAMIGLDDFGTGYSSMTYLHALPLSFLKVDRSFVAVLGDPAGDRASAIVDTVLRLAERFGLDVIAEGVETDVQERRLDDLGCRFVQGYLYANPLTAEQLTDRLAADA